MQSTVNGVCELLVGYKRRPLATRFPYMQIATAPTLHSVMQWITSMSFGTSLPIPQLPW